MKKIEAIIRPHLLKEVKQALSVTGVRGMTIAEIMGVGRQKGRSASYRGADYQVDYVNEIKVEVVIDEDVLENAIGEILGALRGASLGGGKVFISAVESAIRIRTGEYNDNAL